MTAMFSAMRAGWLLKRFAMNARFSFSFLLTISLGVRKALHSSCSASRSIFSARSMSLLALWSELIRGIWSSGWIWLSRWMYATESENNLKVAHKMIRYRPSLSWSWWLAGGLRTICRYGGGSWTIAREYLLVLIVASHLALRPLQILGKQACKTINLFQQSGNVGILLKRDACHEPDLDYLPDQT